MEEAVRPLNDCPPPATAIASAGKRSGRAAAVVDVVLNSVASIVVSICVMWVIRRAGSLFTPAALGVFLLARRLADAAANILQLGTPFTLRRHVSMSTDASTQALYISTGLGLFITTSLVFLLVLSGGLGRWTALTFEPGQGSPTLMLWIGVLAIGQAASNVTASVLIAHRRVLAFNIVTFINVVVWPLWALALAGTGTEAVVRTLAWSTLTFSLAVAAALLFGVVRRAEGPVPWAQWKEALLEFARYGLPRTVSPFVEVGFFLVGPWLVRYDTAAAGYVILALMLLRVGQGLMQPAGYVLAAVAARLVGQKDDASLRLGLNLLLGTLLYSAGIVFSLAYPWTGVLLRIWLGDGPLSAAVHPYAAAMVLSLVPFAVFQGLKELIEMVWTAPRNLYTLFLSTIVLVGVFAAARIALPAPQSVLLGYGVALWVAGLMTLWWIRRFLNGPRYFGLTRWAVVLGAVTLLNVVVSRASSGAPLLEAAGLAAAVMIVSALIEVVLLCLLSPSRFVGEAVAFLWPARRVARAV